MDDLCCVVCAEPVEWVAYGPCGHRDVCAVCIARLRFVCDDSRCCICKSLSPTVFITRALGSLTRVINDFSIFPEDAKDGKVGSYWYHQETQSFFDDLDAYKMIKAMCRLSCSVCDKLETQEKKNSKRRGKYKSVEQLKDHLSRQHQLVLCSLCLENKKVFISEQKLYSQVQLERHIRCGDSEIDGNNNERCGFTGHPFCEFCHRPYYGENELYFHMSTEHYTCHICQRQQSTRYVYYKDYDELESHFREAHFLCEDEACLEKKFIVFLTEADLERHSALEHGGNMSHAKRRTALQLSTCFQHREREYGRHRARSHISYPGTSNHQPSSTGLTDGQRSSSNFLHDSSSFVQGQSIQSFTSEIGSTSTSVPSNGRQSQGPTLDFRSVLMSDTDFPPLPANSKRRRRKSKKKSEETVNNNTTISYSSQSRASNSENLSHSNAHIGSGNSYNVLTRLSDGITSDSSSNTLIDDVGPSSSVSDQMNKESKITTQKGDEMQVANKSLVDRIYSSLEFDKDKFTAFKIISKEYREGDINAMEYISYVRQFGLAHLIVDLARLCPDPNRQKGLMEVYKSSLVENNEIRLTRESDRTTTSKHSKKGKEKCGESKEVHFPDGIASNFEEMNLNGKDNVEESQGEGKSETLTNAEDVGDSSGVGSSVSRGGKKKTKKKSKFLKTRLGESSETVGQEMKGSELPSDLRVVRPDQDSILASVRGVWRNGGGRRLVTMSQARPSTR